MINFVVSDLETALVPNGEKMVQEETIELIMELKEKGVYFAVATGRNYDAVYPMFGKAKDHIVYICNDGGSVIYRDKVISKTPCVLKWQMNWKRTGIISYYFQVREMQL